MRVNAFTLGLAIRRCGGEPPPVDMTSDRFAQDLFPDLDLIRTNGFNDPVDQRDAALETVGPDCDNLLPGLDSFEDWQKLYFDWTVLAESVQAQNESLAATKSQTAECLRQETGLTVDDADPTSFLQSVNIEMSKDGTTKDDGMRFAAAYVNCSAGYFDVMAAELKKRRSPLIERNRELLEDFAGELAAAGYVP